MWSASFKTTLLSIASAVAGVTVGVNIDWWLLAVTAVGVPIGILVRVAINIENRLPADAVKRDIWVSLLLAMANFVLAAALSSRLGLSYLEALGLAIIVSASGSRLILRAVREVARRMVAERFDEGGRRNAAQRDLSLISLAQRRRAEDEIAELARKLTDEPEGGAEP